MNELYVLAVVCFIAMVSPGPDFVLVARNSLACPRPQALATAFGIAAGSLVHAIFCSLGLAVVLAQSALLFTLIKLAGAVYLIYLGVKALFSRGDVRNESVKMPVGRNISVCSAFLEGFLCNLLNPKLVIFLLSLFTQFLSADASHYQRVGVAIIFVVENILYWPLLVLLLQAAAVRQLLQRGETYVEKVCGALLIGLGLRVAFGRE